MDRKSEKWFNPGFVAWTGFKATLAYETILAAEIWLARIGNRVMTPEVLINAHYGVLAVAIAVGLVAGVVSRNRL